MKKKGQAIVEFLVTYGFVILIGLFSLTSLSLYGAFNPQRFIPESCNLEPGLSCVDATFYTYGGALDINYKGMGLIGMQLINNLPKDISHAYVVIDPEHEQCGGYYGVLASPIITGIWKSGTSQNVQFIWLDFVCDISDPSACQAPTNGVFDHCYQKYNICVEDGLGECPSPGLCSSSYIDPLTGFNIPGYFCGDIGVTYVNGECYHIPGFAKTNYLMCDCVELGRCSAPTTTGNCCDSSFANGSSNIFAGLKQGLTGTGTFCPGYEASVDTCPQIDNQMDGIKYLNLDYYIHYKTVGSDIFHNKKGRVNLKNSGYTDQVV